MQKYQSPLIDEWPNITFEDFENVEIQNSVGSFFYKTFFSALRIPEAIVNSFIQVFKEGA